MLRRQAESLGWRVDTADGGAAALDRMHDARAAGQPYRAVLLDAPMPGLDGPATAREMRARGLRDGAVVLLMAAAPGHEMLELHRTEAHVGVDGVLVKPFTASMLADAFANAHGGSGGRAPAPVPSTRRLHGLRLLLVEDNPINRQVACELLGDEGAQVTVAENGAEAVAAVAAGAAGAAGADTAAPAGAALPFDLVLMDVQMPVMDGYTATSRIRQDLGQATLPIVAMTANAMTTDRDACLAAGMNEHVGKPFDLDALVHLVLRLTGRADAPAGRRDPSAASTTQGAWGASGAPAATAAADRTHAMEAPTLPATVQAAAAAAGIDLAAALRRMSGHHGALRRLLEAFPGDARSRLDRAGALLRNGEPDLAARELHTLKGLAATLGAAGLAQTAAAAESRLAQVGAAAAGKAADAGDAANGARAPKAAGASDRPRSTDPAARTRPARKRGRLDPDAVLTPLRRQAKRLEAALPALLAAWPADAAALAPPNASAVAFDRTELESLLREIAQLLADSDMAALRLVQALGDRFGAAAPPHWPALDRAVQALDFDAAQSAVARWLEELVA